MFDKYAEVLRYFYAIPYYVPSLRDIKASTPLTDKYLVFSYSYTYTRSVMGLKLTELFS